MDHIVNREEEICLLEELYNRPSSDLVSITGRRRVGKTFLVRQTFEGRMNFQLTGTQNGTAREQLLNFSYSMGLARGEAERPLPPENWQLAFFELQDYLRSLDPDKKKVVFLDELPWLAGKDPLFLRSFGHFWNSYAETANVLVIICGSATSWIINKVVRDRGGLHNRITQRIHVEPFTLAETKIYLERRQINYTEYAVAETYMVTGGIPFYLNGLKPGLSVPQNIDQLCFAPRGLLRDEFQDLYPALFDNGQRHINVVRALAASPMGLTRLQLLNATGLPNGGGISTLLEELEFSGFIIGTRRYGKRKKGRVYRLVDQYSLFYLRFIEPAKQLGAGSWESISRSQSYRSWTGYAFENIGFTHLRQLKVALGISGVVTAVSSYQAAAKDELPGVQIDLVIERADKVINLCEFRFYNQEIALTQNEGRKLSQRENLFREHTATKSILFNTLVTTYGVTNPGMAGNYVQQVITLSELFQ